MKLSRENKRKLVYRWDWVSWYEPDTDRYWWFTGTRWTYF